MKTLNQASVHHEGSRTLNECFEKISSNTLFKPQMVNISRIGCRLLVSEDLRLEWGHGINRKKIEEFSYLQARVSIVSFLISSNFFAWPVSPASVCNILQSDTDSLSNLKTFDINFNYFCTVNIFPFSLKCPHETLSVQEIDSFFPSSSVYLLDGWRRRESFDSDRVEKGR